MKIEVIQPRTLTEGEVEPGDLVEFEGELYLVVEGAVTDLPASRGVPSGMNPPTQFVSMQNARVWSTLDQGRAVVRLVDATLKVTG